MTISIIESFDVTEGTLFTPTQIGTLVIVGAGESAYSSRPIVGITVGGVSCTEVVYTSAEDPKGGVWYIPEALVPAGALEVVVDWNGQTHSAFQGVVYNLASVDQSSPVHSSIVTSTDNATGTASSLDLQVDAIEGGIALVASGVYTTLVYFDTSASSAASTIATSVDKNWGVTGFRSVVRSASLTVSGTETIATRYTEVQESFAAVAVFNPAIPTITETLDNVLVEPLAGKQFVTIGATPDLTYKSLLYGTDPSAANPDQLESDTLTSDGKAIILRDDGTFKVDNVGTNVQTFNYRVYDMDGSGWSAMATATVTPQAGEPDTTKKMISAMIEPMITSMIEEM